MSTSNLSKIRRSFSLSFKTIAVTEWQKKQRNGMPVIKISKINIVHKPKFHIIQSGAMVKHPKVADSNPTSDSFSRKNMKHKKHKQELLKPKCIASLDIRRTAKGRIHKGSLLAKLRRIFNERLQTDLSFNDFKKDLKANCRLLDQNSNVKLLNYECKELARLSLICERDVFLN
jgi:hypothetical protein